MTATLPISNDPSVQADPLSASVPVFGAEFPGLSTDGRLREGGAYHLLATTDDGAALMLHPRLGILIAYLPPDVERARVIPLGGIDTSVWALVATRLRIRIGSGALPRFWLLEERVPLGTTLYACYDLERWEAVGWTTDEAEAVQEVRLANARKPDGDSGRISWGAS